APRTEPMPPPAQIALGAPGATGRRPAEPAEDVPLGAPGARSTRPAPRPTPRPTPVPPPVGFDEHEAPTAADVSVDLADHIAVRPSDVKEAVRASKVMAAIEAPPGLFDAIDAMDERPAAKPAGMASRPPEPRPPEPRPSEPRPAPEARRDRIEPRPAARAPATGDLRAEPRAPELREARNARAEAGEPRVESRVGKAPGRPSETRTGKAPVELPKQPVPVEKTATTSAPTSRVSPVLIVLLILLIIGGVAFAVWKYVLMGGTSDVPTSAAPVLPPVKPAPPPPAPPPAPTAKIVMEAPAPEDIKSPRTGVIETILADQTAVKTGEPVVKFVGDKPIEAEIAALTRDEKKLRDLIDAATRRRDSAQASGSKADEAKATAEIAEREKTLSTKRDQLSTKTTDLDKFQIHAAANGVFSPVARTGQKVPVDAVVARLQGDPTPSATFAITDPTKFATNTSIDIAVGKGEQRVTCTIAEVQPDNLKVSCPADPAIPEGTDVTLRLPGAAAAPPAPAAPTAPTPEPTAPPPTAPPPTAPRPNAPEAPAPK
ncbi:MAG TPA: hypothetical protein VFK02_23600, partial [Kofleriaceae bacterium]|nr:hypothetical protein [Kofleriaceae bacterium]